jgi:hypothetical protein
MKIQCQVCKTEGSMKHKKVYRFPWFVVFLGWVIALPSIGMAIMAALGSTILAVSSSSPKIHNHGIMLGSSLSAGFVGVFISILCGSLGFIFLSKKKILKCEVCQCQVSCQ